MLNTLGASQIVSDKLIAKKGRTCVRLALFPISRAENPCFGSAIRDGILAFIV